MNPAGDTAPRRVERTTDPRIELEPLAPKPAWPAAAPPGALPTQARTPTALECLDAAQKRDDILFVSACATILLTAAAVAGYFWWQARTPMSGVRFVPNADASPSRPAPSARAEPAPTFSVPSTVPPTPSLAPVAAETATPLSVAPRFRHTATRRTPPPLLEQAHGAYAAGALAHAERAWSAHLRVEPENADARHGLAAIALRREERERATEHYRRALVADPKDARALSGWIALQDHPEREAGESRLKTLRAEQPDSPHPHFVLGNLLAAESRWAEARLAYAAALAAEPANPDYLFNLATSLDRLREFDQAARHYDMALTAAGTQTASFDPTLAATRLEALRAR